MSENSGRAFYYSFMLCMVLIAVPIRNFAYLVPPIYLAFQFVSGNQSLLIRTCLVSGLVMVVSAASMIWDGLSGNAVNPPGLIFAILTYLPFILLASERFDRKIDDFWFAKIMNACSLFIIVQACIGFVQYGVSRNPDMVSGTYGLTDILTGSVAISQVYLTFTIFCMILFLMAYSKSALSVTAILLGFAVVVLAQSGHQTIFFIVALATVAAVRFTKPIQLVLSLSSMVLILAGVFTVYPESFKNANRWYEKTIVNDRSPKKMAIEGGIEILSHPKNLIFGTGLGQYSSRAALISSNEFLNRKLPSFLTGQSDYYRAHMPEANLVFEESGEGSAISKPYFSILSLFVETGLIGSVVLIGWVIMTIWQNRYTGPSSVIYGKGIGSAIVVGLLFFTLCCLVENYAEFGQAIFLPVLLLIAAFSHLRTLSDLSIESEATDPNPPIHS